MTKMQVRLIQSIKNPQKHVIFSSISYCFGKLTSIIIIIIIIIIISASLI